MAAAAGLAITLVPVIMGYFIVARCWRSRPTPQPLAEPGYVPLLKAVLARPKTTLAIAAVVTVAGFWPLKHLGSEFIPPL